MQAFLNDVDSKLIKGVTTGQILGAQDGLKVQHRNIRGYDKATLSDRLSKNSTDRYDVTISSSMSYFNQKHVNFNFISGLNNKNCRFKMSLETLLTEYTFDVSYHV